MRVMGEQGSAWLITAGLIVPPDQGAPQPGAGQGLKGQPGKLGTGLRVHPHKGAEGGIAGYLERVNEGRKQEGRSAGPEEWFMDPDGGEDAVTSQQILGEIGRAHV